MTAGEIGSGGGGGRQQRGGKTCSKRGSGRRVSSGAVVLQGRRLAGGREPGASRQVLPARRLVSEFLAVQSGKPLLRETLALANEWLKSSRRRTLGGGWDFLFQINTQRFPSPPTEVCQSLEVRHRPPPPPRDRRKPRKRRDWVRARGSYTGRAAVSGPRDFALALSLLQGPRPALWPPEPSWKKSLKRVRLGTGEKQGPFRCWPAPGSASVLGAKVHEKCGRGSRIC